MIADADDGLWELTIESVGELGDGLASYRGKTVYVPYVLAGERVRVQPVQQTTRAVRADLVDILVPSAQRIEPACRHFGRCGGCSAQHMHARGYEAYKLQPVQHLVLALGCDSSRIQPLVQIGAKTRRRVDFKVQIHKGDVRLGFYASRSHDLVVVEECPVSVDSIMKCLPALREAISALKKPSVVSGVRLTECTGGLDVLLILRARCQEAQRHYWAEFAARQGLARLSLCEQTEDSPASPEYRTVYDSGNAQVDLGGFMVPLPVGAFLQATQAAQDVLTHKVQHYLASSRCVLDLYCGCGTYGLPLLHCVDSVRAYEGDEAMIQSLHHAIHRHGVSDRIEVQVRDLFRDPLLSEHMAGADAAVINPPRNGALPQVQALCQSDIHRVAMVSCNPATFQRDAQALIRGGFELKELVPVDQFYWSAHLELVAYFERNI